MASRHKIRDETAMSGAVAVVENLAPEPTADALIDAASGFVEEVRDSNNHTIPPLVPLVGGWTRYQVRNGHRIPMLVTVVHGPDLIDGVAFSAWPSDVGNSYGTRSFRGVRRGEGDGEWAA